METLGPYSIEWNLWMTGLVPSFKRQWKQATFASLIMAMILIPYCFALAALIFNGPLQSFTVPGTGMLIFGAAISCFLFALAGSYRGVLAGPHEISAAALGTMSAVVTASMVNAPGEAAFMTMTILLILTSVITGLIFFGIGISRLSYMLRFIPYPVAAGCFAGFGWILCVAALSMMSSMSLEWQTLPRLFDADEVWKWLPGIAFGIILWLVIRRRNSIGILVWSFLILTGVFHLVLYVFGISIETAKSANLLWSGVGASGGLWPAFGLDDFSLVDWNVVGGQIPAVMVVVLLLVLCLLLNSNILEVASGEEIDLDREFRVAGAAGIIAGAGGSPPGIHFPVLSLTSRKLGADTPWTGILTSIWLGMTLFFGSTILELIPISLTGGLLFFIGVDLLHNWLLKVRRRVAGTEYGIIILMALAIVIFGFVEGVAIGMLASLCPLAVYLVRLDPVVSVETGTDYRSAKVRSIPDQGILLVYAERIKIVRLCGYMYFVINYRLMNHLKKLMGKSPTPTHIVLDCREVQWFDASAINVLCMFLHTTRPSGVKVVFATPPAKLQSSLANDLPRELHNRVWFEKTLDHALERCEDTIIATEMRKKNVSLDDERTELLNRVGNELEDHLDRQIRFENLVEQLMPWLEKCEYDAGDMLAGPSDIHDGMQLVVSGRVSINDALGVRLFQYGPGNVLEPKAAFEARRPSSNAVAEEPCVTLKLTPRQRRGLDSQMPDLSRTLYKYMLTDYPAAAPLLSAHRRA